MPKVAALVAVVTLSLATLTACSGGNYCSELQNYSEAIKNFKDLTDPEAVDKLGTEAKKLSKSAPDELKDDWLVISAYVAGAEKAGGDKAKLLQLAQDSGAKVATAGAAIAKQGKDTCNVQIEN